MLTPQQVSDHAFSKAVMGGYNMSQVDEFLDEVTEDYNAFYTENAALKAKMKILVDKVEEYRATEDSMRAALLSAQKMASSMVSEAEERKADLLAGAEEEANRKLADLRAAVAAEEARLGALKAQTAEFVAKMHEICAGQVALLDGAPDMEIPAPQPTASVGEETKVIPIVAAQEAQEEEEVPMDEGPFADRPGFRLDKLKFGRNYRDEE